MSKNNDFEDIAVIRAEFVDKIQDSINFLEETILNIGEDGFSKENIRPIFSTVHSLKGSAGALGFGFLTDLCHAFEDLISTVQNFSDSEKSKFLSFIDVMRDFHAFITGKQVGNAEFNQRLSVLTSNTFKPKKLLVVQNYNHMIKQYRTIFKELNLEIFTAKSGYDAFGMLLEEEFDYLLTDVYTPNLDGISLIKILKSIHSKNSNIKMILSTSSVGLKFEEGFSPDEIVLKNEDYFANLKHLMTELVSGYSSTMRQVESKTHEKRSLQHIVCVDDDEILQSLVKINFRKNFKSTKIDFFSSGIDLINKLPGMVPDLFILDVFMPDMDGPKLLEHIRQDFGLLSPAIFLTGKNKPEERDELMKLGAIGIITKPFNPLQFHQDILSYWNQANRL